MTFYDFHFHHGWQIIMTDNNGYCRCVGVFCGSILRFPAMNSKDQFLRPVVFCGSSHRRNGHPRRDERETVAAEGRLLIKLAANRSCPKQRALKWWLRCNSRQGSSRWVVKVPLAGFHKWGYLNHQFSQDYPWNTVNIHLEGVKGLKSEQAVAGTADSCPGLAGSIPMFLWWNVYYNYI